MKITELLKRDTVIMNLTASNKEAVIDELVEKLNGAKVGGQAVLGRQT